MSAFMRSGGEEPAEAGYYERFVNGPPSMSSTAEDIARPGSQLVNDVSNSVPRRLRRTNWAAEFLKAGLAQAASNNLSR